MLYSEMPRFALAWQSFASNCPFSPAFARRCNRCLILHTCWHLTLLSENASIVVLTCPSGNSTTEVAPIPSYHGHGGMGSSRALIFLIAHKLAKLTVSLLFCHPKGLSILSSARNCLCINFVLTNVAPCATNVISCTGYGGPGRPLVSLLSAVPMFQSPCAGNCAQGHSDVPRLTSSSHIWHILVILMAMARGLICLVVFVATRP